MSKKDAHILVVDDVQANLDMVNPILLAEGYTLAFASDGAKALEMARTIPFDLILLDVMMPKITGFDVCRMLKASEKTRDIPVIFLTSISDMEGVSKGFSVGAVDYITKPFNPVELKVRVKNHLELKYLKEKEIEETQREIIFTMGHVGEIRSEETGKHVYRVAEYSKLFAQLWGMEEEEAEIVKMASAMHDIGKVAISDDILHKKGKLTSEEFETMKTHTKWGHYIFKDSKRPILKAAAIIAHEHHERYDGKGYPRALKGNDIHIYGRITALADVFDALGSKRSYKKAWTFEEILPKIKSERGKHFDPLLVDLFMDNLGSFMEIRDQLSDD